METRQRRSFTDDYKRQAVDLVASSGRSVGSVAKELARDSVLRRWVELRGAGRASMRLFQRHRPVYRLPCRSLARSAPHEWSAVDQLADLWSSDMIAPKAFNGKP